MKHQGQRRKFMRWTVFLAAIFLAPVVEAEELVMIERKGCYWCKTWDAQIGPVYPRTPEGRFAPLRRVQIDAVPDSLLLSAGLTFTPTFLLIDEGRELARLEGYPGEDFFWGLLEQMLRKHTEYEGIK